MLLASAAPRFLGPIGGALADRTGRRRLLRICALGQGVALLAVAAALPPVPVLAALLAVSALFATAFGPASSGSVQELVLEGHLGAANGLVATASNLQLAVGPAVGGLIFGLAGPRAAFAADSATFFIAAALLRALPVLPPRRKVVGTIWSSTGEGLSYVAHNGPLRALVLGTVVLIAFAAIDNVALVFLLSQKFSSGAMTFGLVQTAFGAGTVLASTVLAYRSARLRARWLLPLGCASTAVGSLLTGLAPVIGVAALGQTTAGVGNSLEEVATVTIVQKLVPPQLLGRAFGAVGTMAQIGIGLAYVLGAPLVAAFGASTAFVISAVGSMVGLAVLLPAVSAANRASAAVQCVAPRL